MKYEFLGYENVDSSVSSLSVKGFVL